MKLIKLFTLCTLLVGEVSVFAYTSKDEQGAKYYRGEISRKEYIDSLTGSMNAPKSYQGALRKNPYKAFGDGYYYSDTDGNKMEINPNRYGGWDVRGN